MFIGCDGSGKTTALYYLKLGEYVTTLSTIGFNVETIDVGNQTLEVWDVGIKPQQSISFDHPIRVWCVLILVPSKPQPQPCMSPGRAIHSTVGCSSGARTRFGHYGGITSLQGPIILLCLWTAQTLKASTR